MAKRAMSSSLLLKVNFFNSMTFFERHPIHIRKKIALAITAGVGLILLILLIIVYVSPKKASKDDGSDSPLKNFYNSLLEQVKGDKIVE